eukprot:SAG31_NODE_11955_length_982_cov_1.438279_2_plen_115_part_00
MGGTEVSYPLGAALPIRLVLEIPVRDTLPHGVSVFVEPTGAVLFAVYSCRTPLELKRRVETLVRTIEKELEEPLRKDKEKRSSSSASLEYGGDGGAGSKRKSSSGGGGSSKRKK